MALTKQRKAALDSQTLALNKWCTSVLEIVYKKYPRANIPFKSLMNLYGADIHYKMAAEFFMKRHAIKTGE